MYDILTLNKIADVGLKLFPSGYTVGGASENPDGIVLRSYNMHEAVLGSNLKAVARAGAGVNNIPIEKLSERGIVVFNTPGANANAVKELVLAGLLISSRRVVPGIEWAKTLKGRGADVAGLVEKGKGDFVGPEIEGKRLAVIGLGAIGVLVANYAHHLGMEIVGYDPYMSVKSALGLSRHVHVVGSVSEALSSCDYVSLHVPLSDETRGMINEQTLADMPKGVRILNFSRGELVDSHAIKAAVNSGRVSQYVTDFPNDELLGVENIICIPHLGASTPESEDNCAVMACRQLMDFLENGNIINSVNLPHCELPDAGTPRITIVHLNKSNMLSQLSSIVGGEGINIANMLNKSKKEMAYTIIDVDGEITPTIVDKISALSGTLKVRVV